MSDFVPTKAVSDIADRFHEAYDLIGKVGIPFYKGVLWVDPERQTGPSYRVENGGTINMKIHAFTDHPLSEGRHLWTYDGELKKIICPPDSDSVRALRAEIIRFATTEHVDELDAIKYFPKAVDTRMKSLEKLLG